jgi:hypothetical protein
MIARQRLRLLTTAADGTACVAVTVIAASAAERRRSCFINMMLAPLLGIFVFVQGGRRHRCAGVVWIQKWSDLGTPPSQCW